jgi:hypothetical protein
MNPIMNLLLAAVPLQTGPPTVHIVDDDGGPGVYTSIQDAVNAAAPDDRIIVLAGDYLSFCCDKPLRILGEPGASAGSATIGPTPPGSLMVLSQLAVMSVRVTDAEGTVLLDRLSGNGCSFLDSRDVRIHECIAGGGPGLHTSVSRLEVVESTFFGRLGFDGGDCSNGGDGGDGAIFGPSTRAHLVHSDFTGGKGGDITCSGGGIGCSPCCGGIGGHGIEARKTEIVASFGQRLDLTEDRLVASLRRDHGSVVRFGRNSAGDFVELDRLENPSSSLHSRFARDEVVHWNGETLVGDQFGNGFIHIYREIVGTANLCPVTANSTGQPSMIWAAGTTEVTSVNLILNVAGLPINEFGFFVSGPNTGLLPVFAGNLCIGAPIGRHDDLVLFSGTSGTVSRLVDLTSIPIPSAPFVTMLVPGDSWNLQFWHRDGMTSNFSEAITIVAE